MLKICPFWKKIIIPNIFGCEEGNIGQFWPVSVGNVHGRDWPWPYLQSWPISNDDRDSNLVTNRLVTADHEYRDAYPYIYLTQNIPQITWRKKLTYGEQVAKIIGKFPISISGFFPTKLVKSFSSPKIAKCFTFKSSDEAIRVVRILKSWTRYMFVSCVLIIRYQIYRLNTCIGMINFVSLQTRVS